ncbi:MAG: hypothetical protein F6K23_08850 [Okeania sp. SIO2C9]|uniref:hypothetical protein n=1 Tax=Okeania sp. SIO2C9 TaxID=2607791 RepID=UPI0013BF3127|nr:hypothetical protein [Okeania sp. SIO2C9]NEQ73172.1 hypothetical protein [Okeania sp. SIO2C9]
MVEPKFSDRYENAEVALAILQPLDVNRLPKVRISQENLNFYSDKWGEKVIKTITVSNPIPETILSGRWEVAPHVSDPPHTPSDHSWISFLPHKFEGNNIECKITVDTSKLVENEIYKREIILHNNSELETHKINIQVETGSVPKLIPNFMFFFGQFVLMFPCIFGSFILLKLNPLFILLSVIPIAISGLLNKMSTTAKILILGLVSLIITLSIWVALRSNFLMSDDFYRSLGKNFFHFFTLYSLQALIQLSWITILAIVAYVLNVLEPDKHQFRPKKTTGIITENNFNKLSSVSSDDKKGIMCFSIIGFYFSLGTIFFIFHKVISVLHCLTLGEISVLVGGAIATLSIALIPLIYLILKPLKITYKYRKAEPNLIKA